MLLFKEEAPEWGTVERAPDKELSGIQHVFIQHVFRKIMAFSSFKDSQETVSLHSQADSYLIRCCQAGNDEAFMILMKRYKVMVTNFVCRFVGDYDKAVDIAQETFVRLFRFSHKYSETARFSTWLLSIAANLARTELRRQKSRHTISLSSYGVADDADQESWQIPDETWMPDARMDTTVISQRVQQALMKVSPTNREVVILRDMLQLSYEEISAVTGCELGTVKSRINRGRKRLQEELRDLYEEMVGQ
jgi:RNA polymerase sigma-70 factor (ECF subfamily)